MKTENPRIDPAQPLLHLRARAHALAAACPNVLDELRAVRERDERPLARAEAALCYGQLSAVRNCARALVDTVDAWPFPSPPPMDAWLRQLHHVQIRVTAARRCLERFGALRSAPPHAPAPAVEASSAPSRRGPRRAPSSIRASRPQSGARATRGGALDRKRTITKGL